jgi:hypothetical protein
MLFANSFNAMPVYRLRRKAAAAGRFMIRP